MTAVTIDLATIFPRREIEQFSNCAWILEDVIEGRCILIHTGEVKSFWCLASELPGKITDLAKLNAAGFNIFVGVNPRPKHGTTKDENIVIARVLVVDFDHVSLADALERIARKKLPLPTMVLWTGHGCHAYWRLTVPLTDMVEWRRLQKGLITLLGSDPTICNPERILRLAGWLNLKGEPTPAYLIHAHPSDTYDVEIFSRMIAANTPAPAPRPLPPLPSSSLRMFNANPKRWLDQAVQRARSIGRNNAGLWLAAQLRDDGLSEPEAEGWMKSYAAAVPDAGHEYREHEATSSLKQAFKRPARERARGSSPVHKWPAQLTPRRNSMVMNRGER